MSRMKYLWAAALIALCVGVFAGAALAAAPSWDPTANTLPSELVWDQNVAATITATNDGLVTWDDTISIWSVLGANPSTIAANRWGLTNVPVTGTVVTDASFTWDFTITAPPITTLQYPNVTPTTTSIADTVVAAAAGFDCNWDLSADSGATFLEPTVSAPITVTRFVDVPGDNWAVAQVEQCAGRIPRIVSGYDNGTYRPTDVVSRAQMAVFIQRALELGLPAYTKDFSDVASGYWADNEIQALVDATIVAGYDDNTYRPEQTVTRDQMSVFVARGMAGGDANVTATPTITFTDVVPAASAGHWAYDYVNYCNVNGVVTGYPDNTYRPSDSVTRDQMAVFVYRGFIAPTAAAVALAGPAITAVDPSGAGYDGWTSLASAGASDDAFAYVGLDGVRLQGDDAEVTFELRGAATPTTAATGLYTSTVTVNAAAALAAVIANSGNPYAYASWDIPVASLAAGDYILVTSVNGAESLRKPAFTVTP